MLSSDDLDTACTALKQGEVVGLPTETVYGLGANGLDPQAVGKIFRAKGRPQDNPLILHLGAVDWVDRYCQDIPESARRLMEVFWPGPLTLILQRQPLVPDVVTAGLDTVGVRCPAHPVMLELLRKLDLPIAAPSGNLSGKPSPTTAKSMLEDMDGRIFALIDGGDCQIGVESSILDCRGQPCLLRAGGVSVEALEEVLGQKIALGPDKENPLSEQNAPMAPGMKYPHYAPTAPLTLVIGEGAETGDFIVKHQKRGEGVLCFQEYQELFSENIYKILGKENDFTQQAKELFSALRFFDGTNVTRIWAQCPKEEGLGLAVSNRLKKAAGDSVLSLENQVKT